MSESIHITLRRINSF